MSIATIAAGPELDRLIAVKVMGWTLPEGHAGFTSPVCGRAWNPSEDIADAWLVVERMRASGCDVVIESAREQPLWWARLSPRDRDLAAGCDESLPLAICRAALLAVGP